MTHEQRSAVKKESGILKALKHPNIVCFEDEFKDKKMRWNIIMEYVDNGSL